MALDISPFDNTDNKAINIGFRIIQKFSRCKSVETLKIRDDSFQIANKNSRVIGTAQLRFHTSKLLSSSKVQVRWFDKLRPRTWIKRKVHNWRQTGERAIVWDLRVNPVIFLNFACAGLENILKNAILLIKWNQRF